MPEPTHLSSDRERKSDDDRAAFDEALFALRPWYHDFSLLGYDTAFLDQPIPLAEKVGLAARWLRGRLPGRRSSPLHQERLRFADIFNRRPSSHMRNQTAKEAHLLPLVREALRRLPESPVCLDLFCADGYYACRLKRLAPRASVHAVDLDGRCVERGRTVARKLGLDIRFERADAREALGEPFDLVLCAGGLYHLDDPKALLGKVRESCRGVTLLQSVVSKVDEDPSYFRTPAPGWSHGSRFSDAWLTHCLREHGFEILEHLRLELRANVRPDDRGSSYFLCR